MYLLKDFCIKGKKSFTIVLLSKKVNIWFRRNIINKIYNLYGYHYHSKTIETFLEEKFSHFFRFILLDCRQIQIDRAAMQFLYDNVNELEYPIWDPKIIPLVLICKTTRLFTKKHETSMASGKNQTNAKLKKN